MIPTSEHLSKNTEATPPSGSSGCMSGISLDLNLPVFDRPMTARPEKLVSIEMAEANFRPLIEATRHLWPSPEERWKSKNPKPFVMH